MNIPTEPGRANDRLHSSSVEHSMSNTSFKRNTPFPKMILTIIWAVFHFVFYFLQQVAEIFAPILLIMGIIWKIIPNLVQTATHMVDSADPQIRDMVGRGTELIPTSLTVAGHTISASSLIFDGFLLLALTALCATITAFLGRRI
ncbi:hypothetical protein [Commensalibacter oyaizuii]|uniref:AI-2E family transporter n=1 Tax=Commensalibacter oyaizuii TaxID=3043873 RepID=A0ABT6Q0H8_9PROT|nr:hypothetical protein [Commensalibacter sp. TBRC 16381]MDI2090600.1 hypothetical protein [Commensalibacter sp. TBRC 16381]